MKRELILEGLGCAVCAAKIESEVNELEGVTAAMNFAAKTLTVNADVETENLVDRVTAIAHRYEPDIVVRLKPDKASGAASRSDAGEEKEDSGSRRRQIVKLAIGGALYLAGILFHFPDGLELAIFLLAYVVVGWSVVWRAVRGILRGQVFSEHFLMTAATVGAFAVGEYPEGAAVMIFYLVGEMLQDLAVDHSRKSIGALMNIRPDYANLVSGEAVRKVSPEEVHIGDRIIVKPGEKIPLDGVVTEGRSSADTSALTGESAPRKLSPGDSALSGFINKSGVLTMEVTKEFGESTVSKILDLVENAAARKAPTERFITKFARWYTPAVVFGALALAVLPPLFVPGATFEEWVYRALVFLVVSCPCALVISIPLGFFGGIGGASRKGILVKGANYLEALNHVETVVFDKTGTLTKGVFTVTGIRPAPGVAEEDLLQCAAYAEHFSNHPIAQSVLAAYGKSVDPAQISDYREIPGSGIRVKIGGRAVLAGSAKFLAGENVVCGEEEIFGTVIHIASDGQYCGSLVIADEIKEDAADAVRELKELGIVKTIMLTGDAKAVGDRIGGQLGLDEVYSELLPADKVERLESLYAEKSRRGKVVFVGDGINDAPVLARSDIGIAMGGMGSDAAIEAADIVIMTDEPSKVVSAIRIAKRTRRIILQNIVFALGVKAAVLLMGALGAATMWEAVFADMGVALIAIFNAIRVLDTRKV